MLDQEVYEFGTTIFEAKSILGEGPGGGYPALQDVRFALLRTFRADHLGGHSDFP